MYESPPTSLVGLYAPAKIPPAYNPTGSECPVPPTKLVVFDILPTTSLASSHNPTNEVGGPSYPTYEIRS